MPPPTFPVGKAPPELVAEAADADSALADDATAPRAEERDAAAMEVIDAKEDLAPEAEATMAAV